MLAEIGKRRFLAPIPFPVGRSLMGRPATSRRCVIDPPITADQVDPAEGRQCGQRRLSRAWPELGVTPTTLEAVLPTYLYRYRKGGQYADQEDRELAAV